MHQGILENFEIRKKLAKQLGIELSSDLNRDLKVLIKEISEYIPFLVVTSGRGIPSNLPENAKFISFSSLQDNVLRKSPAKSELIKILLKLTRRQS